MILIDKMKDFKIYKVPTFLPTRIDNKKKFYASLLLTPNYESSKKIMTHPLFINKRRYESYFLQRDVSYYINSKKIKYIDDKELEENAYILEMSSEKRNSLPDDDFGLPKKRKYPLDTEARVRSAIKFFNYVDPEDEKELADNIIKAMKRFNITDINVSDKNRFSKYYKSSNESFIGEDIDKDLLQEIQELKIFNSEDQLIFFNEDAKYDSQLKRLLFQNRIRQRKDSLLLLEKVKKEIPFILYTFPELSKYKSRNMFLDLYYYNEVFFNNNNWSNLKGLSLYSDFLNRLLNNIDIESFGYNDKKIFIPISGWFGGENFWNFRISINPISLIYQKLFTNNLSELKKIFKDTDIIFIGDNKYFKLNFSKMQDKDTKKFYTKFKIFVLKIYKGEEFSEDDIDSSAEIDSSEVITAKIIDRIEDKKDVDLTKKVNKASKIELDTQKVIKTIGPSTTIHSKSYVKAQNKLEANKKEDTEEVLNKPISKSAKNLPEKVNDTKSKDEQDIMNLASKIYNVSNNSNSEDEAIDALDNDFDFKNILIDLQSDGEDDVKLSPEREERLKSLSTELMNKTIRDKTVEEILSDTSGEEIPKTNLEISSPNADEWKNLSFMNFDKNYNIDKDIINAFKHFENTTRPMVIREINVSDNSTSEDRIALYDVKYEDYRGKRFQVKLDIPIMKDNRFLLRGNNKSIQNQFFNMPCLKTETDTCQIISNYNKIFVTRYGSSIGKSTTLCNRFIKACKKYQGNKIKFIVGNNKKVSDKYNLPIDYIDISSMYSKIETDDYIFYFNQDEIRNTYDNINIGLGIPYGYNKREKSILYFKEESILYYIIDKLSDIDKDFEEILKSTKASNTSYSRCSILGVKIPLIIICAYHEGLRKTLSKANIRYSIVNKIDKNSRSSIYDSEIKFEDGYILYQDNYYSSLLMNGLKECPTELIPLSEIDNKNTYLSFLDEFGGRFKADGLDNFYDLMIDPITKETLEYYKLPTDYVSLLLAANNLLVDNKYIRHNDTSSRRIRRYEIVAAYTYKVLANAYGAYCNEIKHRNQSAFKVNQDAVIVSLLTDPTSSDDSCINALRDVETTNSVSTKGLSGMNADRAYSLDKRTYDDSMVNVLGMSTGFSGNVGVSRQTTLNSNIEGERGYVKSSEGNMDNLSDANTLTATEALTPFGSNRDDPMRTAMTFIQTAKHSVRTVDSDPLLVTSGADEALAYMSSDRFAFKAKQNGTIKEITKDYIIIQYDDNTKDYIDLKNNIEKNSDGGYFVPLKLDISKDFQVGDKISTNEIVAYDKYSFSNSVGESDNIAYNIGKLAKVAIVNTDEGFEDSGVITERMAKKLATPINYQFSAYIDKDSLVDKFLKVGDTVEVNDNLITWIPPFDDEAADILLRNLNMDNVSDLGKKSLKSEVTGVITKVAIYRTVDIEEMSDSLKTIVTNYEKPLIALEKKLKANNIDISQIPAHYKLPPVGKLKGKEDMVLVEFYVEFKDSVGVGDKVVYFSANKATEKSLIPEGVEPYTDFRPNEPIDAFVSEVSIDKRMVTSTLIYGSLQKLMIELDRSVKDIMDIPYDDSSV